VKRGKDRGFTLLEVIVLIVMAGILLPAILVPFVASVKGSGKPEMASKAMFLAQQKMEEFMKFNYNQPELSPVALTPYANTDFPGYRWRWSITLVNSNFNPSGGDVGYKRIQVQVHDPENSTYEILSVVSNFP
jgi:type II secretory pathway pseudopilin PulG